MRAHREGQELPQAAAPVTADADCYSKAVGRGQRTFTLVEQDRTAVRTIGFWILENIETAPAAKLLQALEDAVAMRDYPHKKVPD